MLHNLCNSFPCSTSTLNGMRAFGPRATSSKLMFKPEIGKNISIVSQIITLFPVTMLEIVHVTLYRPPFGYEISS